MTRAQSPTTLGSRQQQTPHALWHGLSIDAGSLKLAKVVVSKFH
jgi:hypothetical protein